MSEPTSSVWAGRIHLTARPVRRSDGDALAALGREVTATGPGPPGAVEAIDGWVGEHVRTALTGRGIVSVLEVDDPFAAVVVGAGLVKRTESGIAQMSLSLSRTWWGSGVGHLLARHLVERCSAAGIGALVAECLPDRADMAHILTALGGRVLPPPAPGHLFVIDVAAVRTAGLLEVG